MTGRHNKALGPRIQEWNEMLISHSRRFKELHDDVSIAIFDAFQLFSNILDNADEHGFRDVVTICYDDCVWHDHFHPTARVHEFLVSGLVTLLNEN
jgi:phospholipase/lecithinase/hemolysin